MTGISWQQLVGFKCEFREEGRLDTEKTIYENKDIWLKIQRGMCNLLLNTYYYITRRVFNILHNLLYNYIY